jgi:hypothetical protein
MRKAVEIPHTRDGYRKQLIDLLRQNAYRHDIHTVWSDFVEMGAIAFSNAVDLAQYEEREARYMRIVSKYQQEEAVRFAHALAALTMAMELAGFDDLLGGVFMELELGNKWKGQFFTPYHLCVLMAKMNVVDGMQARIDQQGFIAANDPCTGGGAMIIGLADAMHDAGINYQQHLHVVAQDLDLRSVHMAYLQFSLLHIPAVVIHGNTLAMEELSHWYTPAHVLGNWSARLRRPEAPEPVQIAPTAAQPAQPAHQFNLFEEAA